MHKAAHPALLKLPWRLKSSQYQALRPAAVTLEQEVQAEKMGLFGPNKGREVEAEAEDRASERAE